MSRKEWLLYSMYHDEATANSGDPGHPTDTGGAYSVMIMMLRGGQLSIELRGRVTVFLTTECGRAVWEKGKCCGGARQSLAMDEGRTKGDTTRASEMVVIAYWKLMH